MEYAVIATGGKQQKVSPGLRLNVERLSGEIGEEIRLTSVLAVRKEADFQIGTPELKSAAVLAKILGHPKGRKTVNYRYKRRKGYHRKVGHRQELTRLEILEIQLNGA